MSATGIRKAALLLRTLDPATAGELLGAAPPEVVKQIATELVYLDATGQATGGPAPALSLIHI